MRVLWEYCEIVVMCVIIYNFNLKWVKTFRSYERIRGIILAQCVFAAAPCFWHRGKDKIRFQLTFFLQRAEFIWQISAILEAIPGAEGPTKNADNNLKGAATKGPTITSKMVVAEILWNGRVQLLRIILLFRPPPPYCSKCNRDSNLLQSHQSYHNVYKH